MKEKTKFISKKTALKLKDFSGYPFMNISLVDIPNEKWMAIPQFDDCYLVSNYGRVKAIPRLIEPISGNNRTAYYTKEHIVSQGMFGYYNNYIQEYNFQLSVHIRYERKNYRILVNRLVYELFVSNINFKTDKQSIIHKDGDGLNNKVENLAISNGTHIFYNSLKKDRRPRNTKKLDKLSHQIGVIQYNLKGEKLNHFQSISQASKTLRIDDSNIKSVLNKRFIQIKGFVFRYEGDPYNGEYEHYSKTKKVSQYSQEGYLIKTYNSVVEAYHQTGINVDTISKCALQKRKFARGFIWRYEGESYEGNFTRRKLKIPVLQYKKTGELINKFPSITAAANSINVSEASVRDCINGGSKMCGGYIWRRENQPYHGEYRNFSKTRPVVKSDRSGKILAIFPSMVIAAQTIELTPDAIQKNVIGQNHTAGGFVWRYATEEEIAKMPEYNAPELIKTNPNGIAVEQYTKDGIKIFSFDSISDASQKTGVGMQTIRKAIDNPHYAVGNFVWRRKGDVYNGELKNVMRANEAKIVSQYDLEGNKIRVYPSTHAAAKDLNYSSSWICSVANGKLKSVHGFIWRYGDGPERIDIEAYWAASKLRLDKISKKVSCYDLEGHKIECYNSLSDASKKSNIKLSKITGVVNKRAKSADELIWILGDGPDKIDVDSYFLNGEVKAQLCSTENSPY